MKATLQREACPTPTERAQSTQFVAPNVNIYESKDGYVLEAEMPGVNKDGLEITLEGHEITITGRCTTEVVPGERIFRERHGARKPGADKITGRTGGSYSAENLNDQSTLNQREAHCRLRSGKVADDSNSPKV